MSIEIKTHSAQPIRNTYSSTKRRFGDKPASRYQEASFDVAAATNFHYRPLWDPQGSLNNNDSTCIKMQDWYAVTDPRQFYYGAYVGNRAKMRESAESSYVFCEKRGRFADLDETLTTDLLRLLVPFRHVDLTSNMNNSLVAGDAVATTVTQMHIYQSMDRLGIGQYLSRIALMTDGNTGKALQQSKGYWMDDPIWQPMRKLAEDTLVIKDWFEVTLVQNILLDGLMFPFVYTDLDEWFAQRNIPEISMLTEFMRDWFKDSQRWVKPMLKTVCAESTENLEQVQAWVDHWLPEIYQALLPVAEQSTGKAALDNALATLNKDLTKAGLAAKELNA